jgi:hypothetical protein
MRPESHAIVCAIEGHLPTLAAGNYRSRKTDIGV